MKKAATYLSLCLLLLCCWANPMFAQEKLPWKLKRLGLTPESVVYSDDVVAGFPRGFIYDVHQPDSVYYLGCISSDVELTENYFGTQNMIDLFGATDTMFRRMGDFVDTIGIEPLAEKLARLTRCSNKDMNISTENTDYVILYYWCNSMLDSYMKTNLKFFTKFVAANPKKRIQFLAVSIDKPSF